MSSQKFRSPWMDWKPKDQRDGETQPSAVSTVSPLEGDILFKMPLPKALTVLTAEVEGVPVSTVSDPGRGICDEKATFNELTVLTAQEVPYVLDGHVVATILYGSAHMLMYQDEEGQTWRHVFSWGRSCPVEVSAEKVRITPAWTEEPWVRRQEPGGGQ